MKTNIKDYPRCKTCKHWDREVSRDNIDSHDFILGIGTCRATKQFWDSTKGRRDGQCRVFEDHAKNTLAFTQDGSDYRADLLTREEFGCVSHQPADETPHEVEGD